MVAFRNWIFWTCAAIVPLALFVLLSQGVLSDPTWAVPNLHFFVVSLTSLIAAFVACLMVVAAGQLRDARVVFLSLAFLAIAGVFAVHGLTTPGALFPGSNPWVGFSAKLSLFLGAVFFALSAFDHRPRFQELVVRRQRLITGTFLLALVAYAGVAFFDSATPGGQATSSTLSGASSAEHDGHGKAGDYSDSDGVGQANEEYVGQIGENEYTNDSDTAHADVPGRAEEATSSGNDRASNAAAANGRDAQPFGFLTSDAVSESTTVAAVIFFTAAILYYAGLYRRSPTPMLAGFLLSAIFLLQAVISRDALAGELVAVPRAHARLVRRRIAGPGRAIQPQRQRAGRRRWFIGAHHD